MKTKRYFLYGKEIKEHEAALPSNNFIMPDSLDRRLINELPCEEAIEIHFFDNGKYEILPLNSEFQRRINEEKIRINKDLTKPVYKNIPAFKED